MSVTVTGTGVTATSVNNPNLAAGATTYTKTTTVNITAAPGGDTFVFSAYDKATTGGAAAGNLLAQASSMQTIVQDQANAFGVTLNGNLAKIVAAPAAASIFLSGTFPAFTHVGEAPQTYALTPEDADGNIIVMPGLVPSLTLASGTSAAVTATATSTGNQYVVQAKAPDATVTLTATGKNLAGTAVSTTFTVTTLAALYVANHGINGANPSVSIYPVTNPATAATPIATISGANTLESSIQFPAVDSNGNLYLSNQGPMPGTNLSLTSGYVSVFSPSAQAGTNQTPTSVITGIRRPEGLAFDSKNDLYVMTQRGIAIYGPSPMAGAAQTGFIGPPDPTSAAPAPVNNTDIDGCYGVSLDANGVIYAACSDAIVYFAAGTRTNVAPTGLITPPGSTTVAVPTMPTTTYASQSWLGVATDSSANIYAPGSNPNVNMIDEYEAGATDSTNATTGTPQSATPGNMITAAGCSIPWDIVFDPTNVSYVSNYAGNAVQIFSSTTTLDAGVAAATITSGVSAPFGIAVR